MTTFKSILEDYCLSDGGSGTSYGNIDQALLKLTLNLFEEGQL